MKTTPLAKRRKRKSAPARRKGAAQSGVRKQSRSAASAGAVRGGAALKREIAELRTQLGEAQEALQAIHGGQVDAIVVDGTQGTQVFSLSGAETVYRLAVETMAEAALNVGADGGISFCNARFAEFVATPMEQLIGRNIAEFVLPLEHGRVRALLSECFRHSVRERIVLRAADGTLRPVQLSGSALTGAHGVSLCLVAADLTDLESSKRQISILREQQRAMEHAQTALRDSEERYRSLFASMTEGFALHEIVTDAEGRPVDYRFLEVNPAFERLTGLERGHVVGKRVREILPDIEADWIDAYGGVALTGEPVHFENRSADLGRWYEVFAYRTAPGQFAAVFTDVTERKRADEALAAAHSRLQSIIDNTPAIVYALDLEERFVMANTALAELLNSTPEQMIGKRRHELMPKEDADWHEAHDREVIKAGKALEFEEYSQLKGRSITWLTTKFPLRDAQGAIYAVAGISADISERKQVEQALRGSFAQLEAANKELDAFAYSVSHDLRAPLRGMAGFSRMLEERLGSSMDDEVQHCLRTISESAEQMGRLIEDLLAFSRVSKQPLTKERVDQRALVQKAWEELRREQPHRNLAAAIDDVAAAEGDPQLLKQVWANLIANAVKFTRNRAVAEIHIGSEMKDGVRVYFVRDNGVGFDMRYAHKLFGVFQRLHRAEEYEGTGIGLAIVKRIVERHGGEVWVHAIKNEGATFYFTLEQKQGNGR